MIIEFNTGGNTGASGIRCADRPVVAKPNHGVSRPRCGDGGTATTPARRLGLY